MKKILLSLFILLSFASTAQIYQKIPGYGFRWDRGLFDSVLHVPKSTDTAFRTTSRSPQLRIVGDSLWIYDGVKWKRAGAGGSTVTTLPWDSITGKPANFSTTYALSNDIADSIQARVIVKDNAEYRVVLGSANVKELKAQSRLNFYPDSGIFVVGAAPGSGYGGEIGFDNVTTNGTYWGMYGGSTSVNGMVLYRYQPTQVELAYWDVDRYALRSDVKMAWSSTLLSFGTPDVAISREGASLLQINNGTTNSYADLKLRTLTSTTLAGTGSRMVVADANGVLSTQAIPTGAVTSVNGLTGTVTLTSDNIGEGSTNVYFNNARARSAISVSGSLSYNSTTGVISYTQPTNVSTFNNDAGYITSSVSATSGSTYGLNITGSSGGARKILLAGQLGISNGFTVDYNGSSMVYEMRDGNLTLNNGTVTATQFNGSGAGLTGTASSLSIGGNAATVTNGVYTSGSYADPSWITSLAWSKISGAPSFITGNQTITLSGDASGSGATSIAVTLANSGVSAGTYTKVTVDAKGRVTSGTTLASADLPTYTGTLTSSQVTTALGYTPYNSSNPSGYITSAALSGYAQLSGATFTGLVNGNAGFSTVGEYELNPPSGDGVIRMRVGGTEHATIRANATKFYIETGGVERFNLSRSTGAATFSSSVTAGNFNTAGDLSVSGISYLRASDGVESINTSGIRGASNGVQQINLFDRVAIGFSSGWNTFPNAPSGGLLANGEIRTNSTIVASGQVSASQFYGTPSASDVGLILDGGGSAVNQTVNVNLSKGGGAYSTLRFRFSNNDIISWGASLSGFSENLRLHSPNGSVILMTNGSDRLTISNTGAATFTGGATFNSTIDASSHVTIPNGVFFRARRNTSSAILNVLGFESGTDNLSMTISDYLYVRNTGASIVYSLLNNGNATFAGSVTATSFFESSDIRLKNLIDKEESKDGIDAFLYAYKADKKRRWGYVAQQVEKVIPFAVMTGEDGYKKVDYTTVHTYKIAQLEARIAQLEKLIKK